MKKENIFLIFISLLTLLTIFLLYKILSPFLTAIIWAMLMAIIFYPLFLKLQRRLKKKYLSALVMTLLVLVIIVLPFALLLTSLVNEAVNLYHRVEIMIQPDQLQVYLQKMKEIPVLRGMLERLALYIDLKHPNLFPLILKNISQIITFLFNQSTTLIKGFSAIISFIAGFFFMLLTLYYLFKDGNRFFKEAKKILPLPASEQELLIQRFKDMISATIYGGILIAIIQGILGGLSFWVLGLYSPVLWGTAMALFSFIPLGGTAIIWLPAVIILLIGGHLLKGFILLGLGIFVISMVDNLLKPYFISAKTTIHPLLLFFAVLGGIQAFGLIGVIAGPLVITLFLTLTDIYVQGFNLD